MRVILSILGILAGLALLVLLAVVAVPLKVIWIALAVIGIILVGMFLGVFLLFNCSRGEYW